MRTDRPRVAFFDADETLIAMKSPFSMLRRRLRLQGDDGTGYEAVTDPIRRLAATGLTPVEVLNRFYEVFAGELWTDLLDEGRDWYADLAGDGVPLIGSSVRALREHQRAGHVVAVVSGAWAATLHPLTEALGVDVVRCTEPELDPDGRLTGVIGRPMFGAAKAEAVNEVLAKYDAAPEDCFAYADDPGDLPMFESVGRCTVIGGHPAMLKLAEQHGWPVLSADTVEGTLRQPV
ncbi:HAD family hydrolase [Streptacidiphilus sp. PAMC 29251]